MLKNLDNLADLREFQNISRKVGKASMDYDMFQDGDKVIIGFSGGKDSMTLLNILHFRQSFIPVELELLAVVIDMGLPGASTGHLEQYLQERGFPYHVEKIKFLEEGQDITDTNCFWCSWNRRKALFQVADRLGFKKIALGHHLDDIVETILMNQCFHGQICAMKPKQEFFNGKIAIVRPLAYVDEKEVLALAKKGGYPEFVHTDCPNNDLTQRKLIKDLLTDLEKSNPDTKMNIFKSLKRINKDYLL